MKPNTFTLTVAQLRSRFELEECPYWMLHNGMRQSELLARFRPDREYARSPEEVLIYSWLQLEQTLVDFGHGFAKVTLKKNLSDNKAAAITCYVRWGQDVPTGIGSTDTIMHNSSPGWDKLFEYQEKAHTRHMELLERSIRNEHLLEQREAEIEGMGAPSLQDTLILKAMDIGQSLLAGKMNAAPQGQLGTLDLAPGESRQVGEEEAAPAEAPTQTVAERPVSMDQMHIAAQMLRENLPDFHPNDIIAAIALYAKKDPATAKNYVSMLINQVRNE